jgi:hypothetical protein
MIANWKREDTARMRSGIESANDPERITYTDFSIAIFASPTPHHDLILDAEWLVSLLAEKAFHKQNPNEGTGRFFLRLRWFSNLAEKRREQVMLQLFTVESREKKSRSSR